MGRGDRKGDQRLLNPGGTGTREDIFNLLPHMSSVAMEMVTIVFYVCYVQGSMICTFHVQLSLNNHRHCSKFSHTPKSTGFL